MKIIFLDIDGVLNVRYPGRDEYGRLFHPHLVENLRNIVEKTEAKIVISSTWRMSGLSIMKEMWEKRDLPGEVIDIIPNFMRERGTILCRGDEIKDWLDRHPEVTNYVYIDDDHVDVRKDQLKFFVRTSGNLKHKDHVQGYGLTKQCAEKSIRILNKRKSE